jgi:hypothetical protein
MVVVQKEIDRFSGIDHFSDKELPIYRDYSRQQNIRDETIMDSILGFLTLGRSIDLDIHGLVANDPEDFIRRVGIALRQINFSHLPEKKLMLKFMSGRGRHSKGGHSILKEKIIEALERANISCQENEQNPGFIVVYFDERFITDNPHGIQIPKVLK